MRACFKKVKFSKRLNVACYGD